MWYRDEDTDRDLLDGVPGLIRWLMGGFYMSMGWDLARERLWRNGEKRSGNLCVKYLGLSMEK